MSSRIYFPFFLILHVKTRYNFLTEEDNEQFYFRGIPKLKRCSYLKTLAVGFGSPPFFSLTPN